MPRRNLHRRMRAQGGCLSYAIGILAVAAVMLVAIIAITGRINNRRDNTRVVAVDSTGYVDVNDLPKEEHQLVLKATPTALADPDAPVLTATPEPSPTPTPTPEPTYNPDDPYALVRPLPLSEGFLPIFEKAYTDERRIAITVDECSGVEITTRFIDVAYSNGAKLTLFPTGENVMRSGMEEVLKRCLSIGFELENRCYSATARLYMLNDTMMAGEIWKQSIALSYKLGLKYQPHFLRLYGGDGENDGRTHAYLAMSGYKGIAGWTVNGDRIDENEIYSRVKPGYIYCFKTNEEHLNKMKLLIEEAKSQDYEMVTLNELFGFEANEQQASNNVLAETMPEINNADVPYYFMRAGDCTWATNLLQRRLIELGYLPAGSADGVFGSGTAAALSAFQAKVGVAATGAADPDTQNLIFAADAPRVDE